MIPGGLVLGTREQVALAIIEDFRGGRISREKAALLLGVSWRTVTRWAKAVRQDGPAGIKHGNYRSIPVNRKPDSGASVSWTSPPGVSKISIFRTSMIISSRSTRKKL